MIPSNLNPKQTEATRVQKGPLLIVAGAGSGKTKTLTSLLSSIIKSGANPGNIVAITFTNKAADEMKSRIGLKKGRARDQMDKRQPKIGTGNQPFVGTFHSLCVKILKNEAEKVGRAQNFSIYDADDSLRMMKFVLKKLNLPSDSYKPAALSRKISKIKNELLEGEDIGGKNISRIYEAYESEMKNNNAFDFDDLLEKVVRIFQSSPTTLNKYRAEFKYILVDEYQDINTSQYWFIKLLANEHKNLFVVGDDAQSIYKFRGSDFRNFLNFEKDWPDAKVVLLEQNYRSTKKIIRAASELIKKNELQKVKELWTDNSEGDQVKVLETENEDDEANRVLDELQNELENGNEISFLYRTNAQSRAIEQALLERGITYEIFGGLRFHARKEVKDILATLRFALNPKDSVSKERIEKTFRKKPGKQIISELPELALKLSVAELIGYVLKETDYLIACGCRGIACSMN